MNFVAKEDRVAGCGLVPAPTLTRKPAPALARKVVNLALQGGGSHGALTWGVLDRLLEEERLYFEAVTASSAGAINAVVLADGLAAGGRDGAKKALRRFWKQIADAATTGIFQPSLIDRANSTTFGLDNSPGYVFMQTVGYYLSPYQLNPFNFNPLKYLLAENIDFARVRQQRKVKLFLSATNVETANVKIFFGQDINVEHVLASACLPLLMHAVEVDGEHYWDGGFLGNPSIFPLLLECEARDVILVHITPAQRPSVPKTSQAIMNRMEEISFNAALMREMRSIAYLTKLIGEGKAQGKPPLMHAIEAEDLTRGFSVSSRINVEWNFLLHLHDLGRQRAEEWLAVNFDRLGIASTIDLQAKYV
jgi:NTE family protein